ncbi:Amino acid/polyamine transporter I [Penicillium cosmopolitanum]|uniref:Amino acid/polyamine transporter I n=1 Tax=Penicillium cosmopolitanum TaxID=1131564 RepID=A0A9W9W738_9EURO|nr:Amino acid/polyamine transporter I [Penicillium cosmopolitanum]KAJ5404611.1 Amino acid/polyamine transporter I [Penicillium cosmopolitanum]
MSNHTKPYHGDCYLDQIDHRRELKQQFSFLSMLGLAFAILNSWTALSTSLSISLPSGGSSCVVWGLITSGTCSLCMATSLAEFLSAYPTAGGQYHWVALISWDSWMPIISWITGWVNCSGWVALAATGGVLGSQLILGIVSLVNPAYQSQTWHQFLIYLGYAFAAFTMNATGNSLLPHLTRAAFIWSLSGFAIICVVVLSCSAPNYNSAEFVFRGFVNQTGWPDGVAWLLGLLQGGLGVTGFDAVAHMIEEIPNPSETGPQIMIACVGIGTITGSLFLVVLLFVAGNISEIIDSAATPLLAILSRATGNTPGAICLLMFPIICVLFAATAIMTTSSRMIYAFARDGGLPASFFFSRIHPKLQVPLNALYLNLVLVIIFGFILLGSTSAFNAIISASVVLLDLSYGIPIAVHCLRGRNMLPERTFMLPNLLGWALNIVSLLYISLTTVLFLFPPGLPVTGSNMNYCVVAFGIILSISTIQWFVDGRKNYSGPRVEVIARS